MLPRIAVLSFCLCASACREGDQQTPASGTAAQAPTTEIRVAAAANLKYALDEIAAEFQKANPSIHVTLTYGSSGNLYSQLSNKAPFDIFFSADTEYPRQLVKAGLASDDELFIYAIGRLVVWLPNSAGMDVEALGMDALTQGSIKKIAIANPRHAPYGRAAEAAMKHLGVYDRVKDRLVLGETVAQAAQFVESGAADAGVIALSPALAPPMREKGRYWTIPPGACPKLEQAGLILPWAGDAAAAEQFRSFVTGPQGQSILKRHGFEPPGD